MLNKEQIGNNIQWLLSNGSTPVKYLTYRDLMGEDIHSDLMQELFDEVEKCAVVQEIFSKQDTDGSWCSGGSWAQSPAYSLKSGYTTVSPKYVTTSWILPLLGDMGFTIKDSRIQKACEYTLTYQLKNGFICEAYFKKYDKNPDLLKDEPCRFSIILIGLGKVGAGSDPRVSNAYDLLIRWQRDDGGWVSEQHFIQQNWTRSCPYASYHAAMALYSSGNEVYKHALIRVLKFLLNHLSAKKDDEIKRFFYHGHSIVHELLMFSEFNIGPGEKVINTILEWFMSMYQPDESCFRYKGKPVSKYSRKIDYMDARVAKYRLFHLVEDDWLTYYLTRIISNYTKG